MERHYPDSLMELEYNMNMEFWCGVWAIIRIMGFFSMLPKDSIIQLSMDNLNWIMELG